MCLIYLYLVVVQRQLTTTTTTTKSSRRKQNEANNKKKKKTKQDDETPHTHCNYANLSTRTTQKWKEFVGSVHSIVRIESNLSQQPA